MLTLILYPQYIKSTNLIHDGKSSLSKDIAIAIALPKDLGLFNQLDSIIATDKTFSNYKYYDITFYCAADSLLRTKPIRVDKTEDIVIVMYSYNTIPFNAESKYMIKYNRKHYILPENAIPELIIPQTKKLRFSLSKEDIGNQLLRLLKPIVVVGKISAKLSIESKESILYFRVTE